AGHARRPQAYRLVQQGPARLGGVSRRGQSGARSGRRAGHDPRLLPAAGRAGGGLMGEAAVRAAQAAPPRGAIPAVGFDAAAVLAALPTPVFVVDAGNTFQFLNAAAEQFFAGGRATLIGRTLTELVQPDSP